MALRSRVSLCPLRGPDAAFPTPLGGVCASALPPGQPGDGAQAHGSAGWDSCLRGAPLSLRCVFYLCSSEHVT